MGNGWKGVGLQIGDGWKGVGLQVCGKVHLDTAHTYTPIHTYRSRHTQSSSGIVVKLDLQLYQIDQKNFLLDFKCVNPSGEDLNRPTAEAPRYFTMEFFEICSNSLAQ